ncbi:uncharacterized protein [Linepithema humile]|uniref:uncharacterized protein isoform X2 n=1 Tax=Linepithema humile TaxID=83485 RepID=UPI00351E1310
MELQDIAVHTCGICEIIIEEKNIPTHSCIEGYNRLLIDENFYFYPVTDDDGIVRRSLVDNEDVILPVREHITGTIKILSTINKEASQRENKTRSLNKRNNRKATKSTFNYDEEELLILSVQERRSLWDFTIPLEQQCLRLTKKLWDEVSETLGGKLSGEEAKKKFKNLHDVYRRIIHSENHPSGSARPSPTQKWHHYDSMEFLRDLCLVKKGKASNIDTDDDTSSIGESINNATGDGNNDEELEVLGAPKKKKKYGTAAQCTGKDCRFALSTTNSICNTISTQTR